VAAKIDELLTPIDVSAELVGKLMFRVTVRLLSKKNLPLLGGF
jgi:hypothetical protein